MHRPTNGQTTGPTISRTFKSGEPQHELFLTRTGGLGTLTHQKSGSLLWRRVRKVRHKCGLDWGLEAQGEESELLTHQESGTLPWNPVREKKQECGPNWVAKKMVFANTNVLKNTSALMTCRATLHAMGWHKVLMSSWHPLHAQTAASHALSTTAKIRQDASLHMHWQPR